MSAERQSDSMVSNMEVRMEYRCVSEFLYMEKKSPNDIHQHLANVYGDQPVDVSTVRWWVVRFSSGDSNSGSPPLVQIFMSTACRLLFTAGGNS